MSGTPTELRGSAILDPAGRAELLEELAQAREAQERVDESYRRLTERERDTLHALGDGQSVCEIAKVWVVSEATVRSHVRGLLVKLGVGSQLAAVSEARRNSWLTPVNGRTAVRSRH
jgi:DNA-binding NarL/FixJ family response regulator